MPTNNSNAGPLSELPANLSKPATRALTQAGYIKLEQFTRLTEKDVLKLHGVGPKTLEPLRRALAEKGLSFAAEGTRGT
ncbi:DNA-binding protein [Paenibacillus gansuensis]|uniref:DNA-binding protein n=1 Tax=Paenibacillus gansuensis TaxID=306542 RepID=A0ABW5PAB4_9BACL